MCVFESVSPQTSFPKGKSHNRKICALGRFVNMEITHSLTAKKRSILGVQFPYLLGDLPYLAKKTSTTRYNKVMDVEGEASGRGKPTSAHAACLSLASFGFSPTGNAYTPPKATSVLASAPPPRRGSVSGARALGPAPAAAAALETSVLPEVPGRSACPGPVLRCREGPSSAGMAEAALLLLPESATERDAREKLSLWDRRPDSMAPLTDRQTDSVLELKAAVEDLPVPAEVRRGRGQRPSARPSCAGIWPALQSHRGGSGGRGLRVCPGVRPPRLALPACMDVHARASPVPQRRGTVGLSLAPSVLLQRSPVSG